MKIILFSKANFLIDEIKKSTYTNIEYIKNKDELYNLDYDEQIIFLYHLDNDEKQDEILDILEKSLTSYKLIALRNNTNNIEGCSLLKLGFKAYLHSISNIKIIDDAIKTVENNNIWLYPELMQFLISSIPLKESKKEKLLEKITIKELEVLELIAQGLNNNEISVTLDLAEITIKKHVSSLLKKLKKKDRLSLALYFKDYF